MDKQTIDLISEVNNHIRNFNECYASVSECRLFCNTDYEIEASTLIAFLIENPHFQSIAEDIRKASSKLKSKG